MRAVEQKPRLWMIDGELYDFCEFAHPGGPWQTQLSAGYDVTHLVQSYHVRTPAFMNRIRRYAIPRESPSRPSSQSSSSSSSSSSSKSSSPPPDAAALSSSYEELLKEFHSYPTAPPRGAKITFDPLITTCHQSLLAAASTVDLRTLKATPVAWLFYLAFGAAYAAAGLRWYTAPTALSAACFGLFAWIFTGLLQHEGSHSALSRSANVNLLGRLALVPWANPRTWFVKHTVSHHQFTNTVLDQDVQKSWFLRHHEDVPWSEYHPLQVLTIHLGEFIESAEVAGKGLYLFNVHVFLDALIFYFMRGSS